MPKPKKKKKAAAKKTIKKKVLKKKPARKIVKVKKPVKKAAKKAIKKKSPVKKTARSEKGLLGEITHYFPKVKAAVIKLKAPLSVGDKIKIKGHTTDFTQVVGSLQIDRVAINSAKKGDEIGLMVESRVRRGDKATKL
jgi:hypothetical protein